MAGVLFEDIFDVKDIDPEGKKFERGKFQLKNLKAKNGQILLVVLLRLLTFINVSNESKLCKSLSLNFDSLDPRCLTLRVPELTFRILGRLHVFAAEYSDVSPMYV